MKRCRQINDRHRARLRRLRASGKAPETPNHARAAAFESRWLTARPLWPPVSILSPVDEDRLLLGGLIRTLARG